MSLELLQKMIDADEKLKSQNQDNRSPEPGNETDNSKNENANDETKDESGDKSNEDSKEINSENGDKKESETPKDNNEQNQKVDKSKLSDKEKMEYAFRKQYAKQESKFRSQLEQLQKELQELKKGKEPKITRDNFESDEAYADWKLEQKAKELFEQQQNKLKEEYNAVQMIERQRGEVVNKVKSLFETPDELKLYNNMVKYAIDNGLDDALKHENGLDIKTFIDNSPIGPRVLQHLIGCPDKFNEIFYLDAIDKKIELRMLERELMHDIQMKKRKASNIDNKDSNQSQSKPNVPIIGKLGTTGTNNQNIQLSKQEEERELMRIIRGR